jgi:hypothetical protein
MAPPQVESVQPTGPDPAVEAWFRTRMDFQIALMQRLLGTDDLGNAKFERWVAEGYAKSFADIVDAQNADGEEIRRLIIEDRAAALGRVRERMMH